VLLLLFVALTAFTLPVGLMYGNAMYSTGLIGNFTISWTAVAFFSLFLRRENGLFMIVDLKGLEEENKVLLHIGLLSLNKLILLPFLPLVLKNCLSIFSTPWRQIVGQPLLANSTFHWDCN
jgi:hypothetical protein